MVELKEHDFQVFKDEADFWIKEFGLFDWSITYAFEELEDCYAECRINWQGKCAELALHKWPHKERSKQDIRKSAFHEVCELLLTDLEYHTVNDAIPQEERERLTEMARHGVIRRLENSIFKQKEIKASYENGR